MTTVTLTRRRRSGRDRVTAVGVVLAFALLAIGGCRSASRSATPLMSATTTSSPDVPSTSVVSPTSIEQRCNSAGSLAADLDGDGVVDHAYHAFDGSARLGVCTSAGLVTEAPGAGMSQDFWLLDPQRDGHWMIVFGGTWASGGSDSLASRFSRSTSTTGSTSPTILRGSCRFADGDAPMSAVARES